MSNKLLVQILGAVFVLIGVLGFINDPVLGIFEVDTVHNLVHLLSGAAALFLASTQGDAGAVLWARVFGVTYALVTLLGFLMPSGHLLGLMEINMADNFLHLLLSAVILYVGFGKGLSSAKA